MVADIFKGTYPLDTVYNEDECMYDGHFYWNVPGHTIVANNYRIKIASIHHGNVFALSEAFSIATVLPVAKGTLSSGLYCMKRPEVSFANLESEEARLERLELELKEAQEAQRTLFAAVLKDLRAAVKQRAAMRAQREREALLAERDAQLKQQQMAERRRKLAQGAA